MQGRVYVYESLWQILEENAKKVESKKYITEGREKCRIRSSHDLYINEYTQMTMNG